MIRHFLVFLHALESCWTVELQPIVIQTHQIAIRLDNKSEDKD